MAVSTQDYVAGFYQTGFQHDMLSDAVIYIEDVSDTLAFRKLPDDLLIIGNFFGMRRRL